MKIRSLALICAGAGFLFFPVREAAAGNVSWSVNVFVGPLGQCGHWVDRAPYGRCWYPAYVASDWRPYCEGYWMWTDCGWYWVSDEPWAWACYHYGRWAYDPYYGWVWIPDTEWGPSWVCWREGGDYIGWAPLPPGSGFGPEGHWREPAVSGRFFVFVGINHFSEPVHRRAVTVNNTTIINKTVNVTKYSRVNSVVINDGPDVKALERVSSRKLTVAPMRGAGRAEIVKPGEPMPGALKGAPAVQHEPPKHEQSGQHAPEIIRGPPGVPTQSSGALAGPEPQQKKFEKQPVGPQPGKLPPSPSENPGHTQQNPVAPYGMSNSRRNFESGGPRSFAPVEPDSIQPRQHINRQKPQQSPPPRNQQGAPGNRGQPQQDQGKPERQNQGQRGGAGQ